MPQTTVSPEREHTLCASLCSRNAFQHFTRATLYGNLQVKGRRPEWAPWSSTGFYTVRTLIVDALFGESSWNYTKEEFVRDVRQELQDEDAKKKLSWHGRHPSKDCKLKLCKRSFPARHPLKIVSQTCGNETFVRDILQKLQDEHVKTTLSWETSLWKWRFCVRHSSKIANRNCEIEISLETYCHTSKSANWSGESEISVRNIHQKLQIAVRMVSVKGFQSSGCGDVVSVQWFQGCGCSDIPCVSGAVSAFSFKKVVPVSDVIHGVASMEWLSWCGFSEVMWLRLCGDFSDVFAVLWFRWSGSSDGFFRGVVSVTFCSGVVSVMWLQWRGFSGAVSVMIFQWSGVGDVVAGWFRWGGFGGEASMM